MTNVKGSRTLRLMRKNSGVLRFFYEYGQTDGRMGDGRHKGRRTGPKKVARLFELCLFTSQLFRYSCNNEGTLYCSRYWVSILTDRFIISLQSRSVRTAVVWWTRGCMECPEAVCVMACVLACLVINFGISVQKLMRYLNQIFCFFV